MSETYTVDNSGPDSIPAQPLAPARVIKLYTPSMIFWLGMFLSLPSALVLSSINWFRLGKRTQAITYLALGSIAMLAVILYTLVFETDRQYSSTRCLTLGMNLVLLGLLYSKVSEELRQIQFPGPVYQKESLGRGVLIALATLAGLFVIIILLAVIVWFASALLTPSHGPVLPGQQG